MLEGRGEREAERARRRKGEREGESASHQHTKMVEAQKRRGHWLVMHDLLYQARKGEAVERESEKERVRHGELERGRDREKRGESS
jgi:hypothetical protein